MIRLKSLLYEEDINWDKPFSLSPTDPWEYRHDPIDGKLYTRKRGGTKWIDMQSVLSPEKYDIAYRRIKDIVSGLKPGGEQTTDTESDKVNALLYIKNNVNIPWVYLNYELESTSFYADPIACAGDGVNNKKGRINIRTITNDEVSVVVPIQYKWDAAKILNKLGKVNWSTQYAWVSGTESDVTCDDHPLYNKLYTCWNYNIDVRKKYKEVAAAINLMINWTAFDKK